MDLNKKISNLPSWFKAILLLLILYLFLVSISLMGAAFKNEFFKGISKSLIEQADPFVGLFIGILATSLIQSSSTTTSMIVTFFAASLGAQTFTNSMELNEAISAALVTAVPMIMGANIGTSVTNTIVSIAHISVGDEFKKAFSAATIHDFFNIMSVIVILPLQYKFNVIGETAHYFAKFFIQSGVQTEKSTNYYKIAIKWVANPIKDLVKGIPNPFDNIGSSEFHAIFLLIVGVGLLLISLKYLVTLLKSLVLEKAEKFFDKYLFRNAALAMLFGVVMTISVQSSSVTTSLIVPLVGAGVLTLRQIYPFTLGANIGTTVTAIIAAAAVVDGKELGLTIAFAHLLFNITGIILLWPIKVVRDIPMQLSLKFADIVVEHKSLAFVYILVMFFGIPLSLILIS